MKTIHFFLMLLCCMNSLAQQRAIRVSDYRDWETLSLSALSSDGNWLAYRKNKITGDTLFIRDVKANTCLAYPGASHASFSPDTGYAVIQGEANSLLKRLHNGKELIIENAVLLGFSKNSAAALFFDRKGNVLTVVNLHTFSLRTVTDVNEVILSPISNYAAIVKKTEGSEKLLLCRLEDLSGVSEIAQGSGFSNLTWNDTGSALAFYSHGTDNEAYQISAAVLRGRKWLTYSMDMKILGGSEIRLQPSSLVVSKDGNTVYYYRFFPQRDRIKPLRLNNPVVMHSPSAKLNLSEAPAQVAYWSAWLIPRGGNRLIETKEFPNAVLTGDGKHALVFREGNYLPQSEHIDEFIDMQLIEIATGKVQPFLDRQVYHREQTLVSPGGRYIAYFRQRHWYVYDIQKGTHRCISGSLHFPMYKVDYDLPGAAPPYGLGGWTKDDSRLYIYDQYDIWEVNLPNGRHRKITAGRENRAIHRIYDNGILERRPGRIFGFAAKILDSILLLKTVNAVTLSEGLSVWDGKKGLRKLVSADKHLFSVEKVSTSNCWIYFESDFDQPPLVKQICEDGDAVLIEASNPQQARFLWGRSELVHYFANGKELKGALFFPAGYDPSKSYPMVVNIYERLSHLLHLYVAPNERSDNGINITHLTANGYFVFCPDIYYTNNQVGRSALECVEAGIAAATAKYNIDSSKIALNGHSFGGYQTAYIVGQSTTFATAIVGAAITDLRSFYLTYSTAGYPNMDLFYSYQFRLSAPLDSPAFVKNSPLEYIGDIEIPLLLWTSDSDPVVDYRQTVMFFNALWTLGKQCTLLIYPKEDHSLIERANQHDLTKKMLQWLDYRLKGAPKPEWVE